MENQLYEALKYAYELLLDQAKTGHYPFKALVENGGKGYEPIQTAIKAVESKKIEIFDLLIERLGKCFNADPDNNGKVFDAEKAKKGWEHRDNELMKRVYELERKFNLC